MLGFANATEVKQTGVKPNPPWSLAAFGSTQPTQWVKLLGLTFEFGIAGMFGSDRPGMIIHPQKLA